MASLFGNSRSQGDTILPSQRSELNDLFRRATSASNNPAGQQFAEQFQPGAFKGFQDLLSGNASGNEELMRILSGSRQNADLQGEIDAGLGDLTRNFREGILPGINATSSASGGSGGSRQGIAQGLATQGANRTASDFITKLRSQNYATGLNASLGAANQLGTNFQSANQARLGALGQATDLSNLGFGSQFGALSNLADILGEPVKLGGDSRSEGGISDLVSFSF